jgi:hypothetical protein
MERVTRRRGPGFGPGEQGHVLAGGGQTSPVASYTQDASAEAQLS